MRKAALYGAAFVIPPAVLGTLLAFSTITDLMIHKQPEPLAVEELARAHQPAVKRGGKPVALIAMSNSGTQVTDLLASYEVLAESGAFQVYTVAQERKLSATTGKVAVLPDFNFKDAPPADLLVVAAVTDDTDSALIDFVQTQAKSAKWVLSLGEGARILAKTGTLAGKKATSHFLALESLRQAEPRAEWIGGAPYLADGKFITSAGIATSGDAALFALEKSSSVAVANETARRLGLEREASVVASASLSGKDFFQLFMNGGYAWHKPELGVAITPGMDEIALAAVLDVLPRTLNFRMHTISGKRQVMKTRHGLALVATESLEKPPILDFVIVQKDSASGDPELAKWIAAQGIATRTLAPWSARPFDSALELAHELGVAKSEGIIPVVQTLIGARETSPARSFLPWFSYRPVMIGFVGVFFVWLGTRRRRRDLTSVAT